MALESVTKKKRTRVAAKPKLGTTGAELSASTLQSPFSSTYTSVPRVMRSRIDRASQWRKTNKQKKTDASTDVHNQPIARSNSGKVALGPWSGAFGQQESDVPSPKSPVIYIDRAGSTHVELEEAKPKVDEAPSGHRKGTILATSPAALNVPAPPDEAELKLHSREVATLQQKPIVANWGRSACGKQACKGRAMARVGFINQPKRGI